MLEWIGRRVGDASDRCSAIARELALIAGEWDIRGGSADRPMLERRLMELGHPLTRDAESPLLVTVESMGPVRLPEVLAALPEADADRFRVDLRETVQRGIVADPEAAVEAIDSDDGSLSGALRAQGDRSLVLAGRAHIPFAALVGYRVTDRDDVRVLDWHSGAGRQAWSWPNPDDVPFPPLRRERWGSGAHAAVLASLSLWVTASAEGVERASPFPSPAIERAVGVPDRVVHLWHPELEGRQSWRRRAVLSGAQARAYGEAVGDVLDELSGITERVDLFLAGPLSVAFEIGRRVARTMHPPVTVWNWVDPRYDWGIELNPRAEGGAPRPPRAVRPQGAVRVERRPER